MTEEYLKLTGADQERERKEKEDILNESKNKSSFNPGKSTIINGQCLKDLADKGFLPIFVGGLQPPKN